MDNNFIAIEIEDSALQIIETCSSLYAESSFANLLPLSEEFLLSFKDAIELNQVLSGEIHADWNASAISYLQSCGTIGVFAFRLRCIVSAIDSVLLSARSPDFAYAGLSKINCVAMLGMEAAARFTAREISKSVLHSSLIPELRNKRSFAVDYPVKLQLGGKVSVAFIDMDGLKRINDGADHATGDRALRQLGLALVNGCSATQTAYHFSGDEFGLLSIGDNVSAVALQLDAIVTASENKFSYGIAIGNVGDNFQDVLDQADRAMTVQKKERRASGAALPRTDSE